MTKLTAETIEGLAPGVRGLVVWLNEQGFPTTDSGDGSSCAAGMEGACEFPMVAITARAETMIHMSDRLAMKLQKLGLDLGRLEVGIEASYSPVDETAVILLTGVLSEDVGL